jgi:hypothetical protein
LAHRKNPAAVALAKRKLQVMTPEQRQAVARIGGLVGGPATAKALSQAQRRAIARKAAIARWKKGN